MQLLVGGSPVQTAEVLVAESDGDIVSVSSVQENNAVKTIDVEFSRDIDFTNSTLEAADFAVLLDLTLDGSSAKEFDTDGVTPTNVAAHSTEADTVTLTVDPNTDVDNYVSVGYSDASGDLVLVAAQVTGAPTPAANGTGSLDLQTATIVTPPAVTEFNQNNIGVDASDAGEDNVFFNMASGKVDGGDVVGAAGENDDYTAFGGDGDDSADSISGGDVFIGGDGNDTANLTGSFQDYTFYRHCDWRYTL